ncbi:hypothetical protein [Campylobacter helveticus]|uniref:hypothetical protein n=1 Tax=Campylobacter helveticus TaxID=28898 RepID=UPI00214A377B|nr:hypothetical protein [Campylobacter helveticus]MCR2067242.1 hypothetical protein [Campylobacter helveticus]
MYQNIKLSKTSQIIYDKLIAFFADEIKKITSVSKNTKSIKTPFEYKGKIASDTVLSLIHFRLNHKILYGVVENYHSLAEKIIFSTQDYKDYEKTAKEFFNALIKYNQRVALSKLFIMDKVLMYHKKIERNLHEMFQNQEEKEKLEKEILSFTQEYTATQETTAKQIKTKTQNKTKDTK